MKSVLKSVCVGLFWLLIVTIGCSSKNEDTPDLPPTENPPPANSNNLPEVDNEVAALMAKHNVPGVSIAITKNGKLVYAKGYGFADQAALANVTTASRFRVASLSKPITGIAIMKLAEEGKLSLDAKVFGPGAVLGTAYGSQPYGAGITEITVRQLLNHTSGGWVNNASDPMFTNPGLTADQLISWTLDNMPLNASPGTTYAYSNFGYSILGRIIEKVTGKTYEEYVKSAILQPIGITTMEIGGNTEADRKANEVKYYAQNGGNAYVYNIARMDAHGGWIATATDLVKLLVHADGFASKPDVLSPQSIQIMTTGSAANQSYGLGWMVNASGNWWHTGSLPGTATMLARTASGYTWAILTNTRSSNSSFGSDVDQLVWKAINNPATRWPDVDLFEGI